MADIDPSLLQTPQFGFRCDCNNLLIPPSFLQFPLLEETLPAYMAFATLGQMIGQQLGFVWRYFIEQQDEVPERLGGMNWIIAQADVRYSGGVFGRSLLIDELLGYNDS